MNPLREYSITITLLPYEAVYAPHSSYSAHSSATAKSRPAFLAFALLSSAVFFCPTARPSACARVDSEVTYAIAWVWVKSPLDRVYESRLSGSIALKPLAAHRSIQAPTMPVSAVRLAAVEKSSISSFQSSSMTRLPFASRSSRSGWLVFHHDSAPGWAWNALT